MKFLVTGGAGFIGSHLVDTLLERGDVVLVIDNLVSGKKENLNPKAKFYCFDVCDFEKIKPLFHGVDYVFHLAAIPKVQVSIKDPIGTSHVNILGTINVFKAATEAKVKRVIFSSSSAVYGEQNKLPIKETARTDPINPYGLQKLVGEQFAKLFYKIYKLEVISLRYFNIYGPRIDFDSDYSLVLGKFLRLRAQDKPLTIFGDGKQTRSFCYVEDVVQANLMAAGSERLKGAEIINIGSKESYSINYLSQLIGGEVQYLPSRVGDPIHTKADITLAESFLNWKPKIDFKEGVEITKQWFQKKYRNNKQHNYGKE